MWESYKGTSHMLDNRYQGNALTNCYRSIGCVACGEVPLKGSHTPDTYLGDTWVESRLGHSL
jgi:hypothetical protein